MQLMALNALLLFDAIFIFFLFLVSVSCLLYYLPLVPPSRSSSSFNNLSESERILMEMEGEQDIESALDECTASSQSSQGVTCQGGGCPAGPQGPHTHICSPIRDRTTSEEEEEEEELYRQSHRHHQQQHQQIHMYPNTPTRTTTITIGAPNDPATHIIMTPPSRSQGGRRDKSQPFAPIETV